MRYLSIILITISSIFTFAFALKFDVSMYDIWIKTDSGSMKNSGFVINEDGYLITNYSFLGENNSNIITAKNPHDTFSNIVGIKGFKGLDLAILQIKNYDKDNFLKFKNPEDIKVLDKSFIYANGKKIDVNILKNKKVESSSLFGDKNLTLPLFDKSENIVGICFIKNGDSFSLLRLKDIVDTFNKNGIKYHTNGSFFSWVYWALLFLIFSFLLYKKRDNFKQILQKKGKDVEMLVPLNQGLSPIKCLENSSVLIGRSDKCDMVLLEALVSRKHSILKNENGILMLKNLNPQNGTFVNNIRLGDHEMKILNRDDRVYFGTKKVLFWVKI